VIVGVVDTYSWHIAVAGKEIWMSSDADVRGEAAAQEARDVALRQRPQDVPWPPWPGITPFECDQYWQEAAQWYEMAREFYASGNHKWGDYCTSRGDAYWALAINCSFMITRGIPPTKEAARDKPYGVPDVISVSQLQEKLEDVRGLRDADAPPLPAVPASRSSCDGWGYASFGEMLCAHQAYEQGDTAGGDYHTGQAQAYMAMYQSCLALQHTL
jgi:hypothetical protein